MFLSKNFAGGGKENVLGSVLNSWKLITLNLNNSFEVIYYLSLIISVDIFQLKLYNTLETHYMFLPE